ncbi:MBOAT family protein [Kordia sp. YSTF-M3]|uniref:MBOAT family protein n=1 Tax=Kordia aestuariivivens TaxID=2759037 RepID=A0ABR7Q9U1_9FLAO|nr:MBOAT family protein [Kordia aestuariivivens]MBC8755136.1 MBOAT family protein [Kordia aestuariivivens]
MLFNSLAFLIFLPIVFSCYWFLLQKQLRYQNILILGASYVFYGWWDWRFLSLIIFSTIVDYSVAKAMHKATSDSKRKYFLYISLAINLGLLGFFKYFNFFIESWVDLSQSIGLRANISTLSIILPVGISFYTFQTLSYTIDVYRRKIEPETDIIKFSAFVAFFPQLVAGPIERASNLLPQFSLKRTFSYEKAVSGVQLILWGLFKKVVIADSCATYVNIIFENSENYNSSTLILGAIFFAFQIYGDFSGYSDIAIGVARLFGFDLMTNFKKPYFSRDIAEFWRRWHISLSTWFRDYVYIPLGGSKGSLGIKIRNVFIIFLVSGFWHGANLTFIFWGLLNALFFIPLLLLNKNRSNTNTVAENHVFPSLYELYQVVSTFIIVTFAWIFFRAENLKAAFTYLQHIFEWTTDKITYGWNLEILILLILFIVIEWVTRTKETLQLQNPYFRWIYYIGITQLILFYGAKNNVVDFIYFQF